MPPSSTVDTSRRPAAGPLVAPAPKRQLLNSAEIRLMVQQLVTEQGASARAILAGSGVSERLLADPARRLTLEQELELYTRIAALNSDPLLGLRVGARLTLSSYGILGYAVMGAQTVAQALELLAEFSPLISWASHYSLHDEQYAGVVCRCLSIFPTAIDSRAAALEIDSTLASLQTIFNELLGEPVRFASLQVTHAGPASRRAEFRQRLQGPISFNCERNALLLPMDLLARQLPYPQPEYSSLFRGMCRQSMSSLVEDRGLVDAIRALIREGQGSVPSLETVAAHFKLSSRTLRRHLRAMGFSYQGLLDEVRYAQACRYLSSTRLTVEAIARQLGYADARSFRTAFKRWSGSTPAHYRELSAG
jgi:hypothetical protein